MELRPFSNARVSDEVVGDGLDWWVREKMLGVQLFEKNQSLVIAFQGQMYTCVYREGIDGNF